MKPAQGFGVANYYRVNGDMENYKKTLDRTLEVGREEAWMCFETCTGVSPSVLGVDPGVSPLDGSVLAPQPAASAAAAALQGGADPGGSDDSSE